MNNLIELFEKLNGRYQSLELDILWDKICDWQIKIVHTDSNTIIYECNHVHLEIVASEAYLALYNWKIENE